MIILVNLHYSKFTGVIKMSHLTEINNNNSNNNNINQEYKLILNGMKILTLIYYKSFSIL